MEKADSESSHCIFCSPKKNQFILQIFPNFYISFDAAPLGPAHILLIPKKHIPAYGTMPPELNKEFLMIRKKNEKFFKSAFDKYIIFEHGIFGQTVKHAHLHFLAVNKKILPEIKKKYRVEEISNNSLSKMLKDRGGYLYFEENSKKYNILAKKIPPGFFHTSLLSKILNVPRSFEERNKNAEKYFKNLKKLWNHIEN